MRVSEGCRLMLEQALKKLQDEMDKEKNNSYVVFIGGYLKTHIQAHPADAALIMDEKKTIAGSLEKMKGIASKQKIGNVAVIAPDQGFKIINEYFGIHGEMPAAAEPKAPVPVEVPAPAAAAPVGLDISLDDLL